MRGRCLPGETLASVSGYLLLVYFLLAILGPLTEVPK